MLSNNHKQQLLHLNNIMSRNYKEDPNIFRSAASHHSTTKLVVENLHYNVSETDLMDLFQPHGLLKATLKFDISGRSLSTAILTFPTYKQACDVIEKHQGLVLDHQPMQFRLLDKDLDQHLMLTDRSTSKNTDSNTWKHDRFDPSPRDRDYPQRYNTRNKPGFDFRSLLSHPNRKLENYDLRQEIGYSTKELRNAQDSKKPFDLRSTLSSSKTPSSVIQVSLKTREPTVRTRPGDEEGEIVVLGTTTSPTNQQPIVVPISIPNKRGRGRTLNRTTTSLHDRLSAVPVNGSNAMDLD